MPEPGDPFRPLERDSDETLAWQSHQNDLADAALRREGFDELRRAVAAHLARVSVTAYPPTLVVAGANDMRCPAWHARKFIARLQDEARGGPFVLRVMGGGHLSTRRGADLVAEWQGFLLDALGTGPPR